MKFEALVIGGPKAGSYVSANDSRVRFYEEPELSGVDIWGRDRDIFTPSPPRVLEFTYERICFRDGIDHKEINLWVSEDKNVFWAMQEMMKSYQNEQETERQRKH